MSFMDAGEQLEEVEDEETIRGVPTTTQGTSNEDTPTLFINRFAAGDMGVFPDDLDWDGEGDDEAEEYDEEGFRVINPEWYELWHRVTRLLEECGLTGDRLVLQETEVPRLLSQLLEELEVSVNNLARDFLTARIHRKILEASEEESRRKRFRGIATVPMQRIRDAAFSGGKLDADMEASTSLFFYPRRGVRSRKELLAVGGSTALTRDQAEKTERERWENLLCKILTDGRTPAYELAIKTRNPSQALMRSAGKTRPSTLKGYLKRWLKMSCWLQRATGQCWPRDLESAMDYVEVIAEDLYPTVPQATLQALQWVERAGGFRGEDAIFSHPSIVRAFDNLTVEAGSMAKARKQSPRFPFVLIAAAELFGTDPENPIMKRIHANSLVFRTFGTLRLDDLQNLDRTKIRKMGSIYVSELLKSKTSGPGKRNSELPIAIAADATLLETDWLLRFLDDLEESSPASSDFLLFSSTYDGTGAKAKMKSYEEAAADTRQIVSCLKVPTLRNGKWVPSGDPVIPHCCIGAIKEHGGRAVLPSAAVFVEPDKSKRDMLGKWLVTGGSLDYTRSYRANVAKMQLDIVKAVKSGRMQSDLREDDIGDQYVRHLTESKGWERKAAEEVVNRMFLRWDAFYRELAVWEGGRARATEIVECIVDAVPLTDPVPVLPSPVPNKKPVSEYRFMIVYTRKRKVACLHKATGGCAWTRIELNDFTLHDIVVPEQYNKRCRLCWSKDEMVEDSSDTSSPSD